MKSRISNLSLLPVLITGLVLMLPGPMTAQTLTTLYTFSHYSGAGSGALILSGNTLYGTAQNGGSSGWGTVFAVNTDGTGFTTLHNFTASSWSLGGYGINSDGAWPNGGLILSGNTLYGTAYVGGSSGNGTVFAVNTDGTGFTNLHNFTAFNNYTNSDGAYPLGGLLLSGNTLYGTTENGGSSGWGTVFAINTKGTGFTTLHSFTALVPDNDTNSLSYGSSTNSDGANPFGGLLLSGNTLYGTAAGGGSWGQGTVFGVNTNGTGFTTLHSFTGGSDGASPDAGLILSGNTLYGTTIWGGSSIGFQGFGTVFSIDTNATGYFVLYSFTGGSDGTEPSGLILTNNTLYGTTSMYQNGLGDDINSTLFSLAVPAGVEAQLLYMTNNGAVTISAYRGSGGVVIIPSIIAGLPVTTIGDSAFNGCTSLTSITIPNSVTNIGDNAFGGCTSLTGITVEALNSAYISVDGVLFDKSQTTLIQYPAGQTGTSYTIPNSVTSIGEQAFARCSSLTNVTIGNSVTSIETNAFSYCTSLVSVTIGNSVTNVGDDAFWGCADLTSVYFQGNAPSFGTNVFVDYFEQSPWGILPIWDPATIYYLPGTTGWSTNFAGLPAFMWDSSASMEYTTNNGTVTITGYYGPGGDVTIPSTINGQPVASIGGYYDPYGNWFGAFQGCTKLTSVTIPNSVTNIGGGVFSGCGSLTAITVDTHNPVYSDVDGVLFNQSLTTLVEYPEGIAGSYTIPDSVTSIGDSAFIYCTSLTSVTIGTNVTNIGDNAFTYCTSLTSVTIPDSVTSIGVGAFSSCGGLTSVTIGNSVTNIGSQAFYDCTSLANVTIAKGVTSIGEDAFGGSGLISVTIPNSVTSIGYDAFYDCTSLTSVTIGSGVTNIGDRAFFFCTSLRSVYFEGNAPTSLGGSDVFYNCNSTTVYYLPGTTGWTSTFGGRPTAQWVLPNPLILNSGPSFGVQTNGFGFIISWATNIPVVVEASTNLANHTWYPLATNTLSGGSSYFSDPQWTNYPARFYRLRSP